MFVKYPKYINVICNLGFLLFVYDHHPKSVFIFYIAQKHFVLHTIFSWVAVQTTNLFIYS